MKQVLAALALLAASACGFQPVYAPGASSLADSGPISVEPIRGRSGYMLRQALQRELAIGLPGITEPATLNVILDDNLTRLAFQPDGAASRSSVVASGRYVLARESGTVSGEVDAVTDFAVPDAPYGDVAAQTGAYDRTMRQLAKNIVADLRLQLAAN
ncbi:LPS assembly lipoprotein LptE [Hyphomonas johnsonii]|jgi:LPS-assembly lipoprotein|uniref:Putative lipoprotein n=1 Tax=Hyphomonas johnsonii MHS-2 TaxID=1280950 RepID=A0A059FM46_9PROT|nr:LPS assembly lipoprotein LptE [Hyphomonas johnsonii]KCZ91760.1 putative lipoprotein [Hyphomonas johnsonii MHS-2]